MFTKKVLVSALFAAGMLGAAVMPQTSVAAIDVYVNFGPPAERYERVPEARRGYVWSPGYWDYRQDRHVWEKGAQVRERQGYAYEPNRWVERDGRWNLERSRWNHSQRGDSDGDGIHSSRDATPYGDKRANDRDRDGVPDHRDAKPNNKNKH